MFTLLPIYKFEFESKLSQKLIVNRLNTLLKKEEKSKNKFEIHIEGFDWGIEEFQGVIEEDYFELRRYIHTSNDIKFFVYSGKVIPSSNGSVVKCVFRFDYFLMFMLVMFFIGSMVEVSALIVNKKISTGIFPIYILVYSLLILGFNYRIKKVKDLFEMKLRKIN